MSDTQLLILARALERLIVAGFSGLSIVMGWNLFRVRIVRDQAADFAVKDFRIRLARVGPGVFFAMFGMGGLLFSLAQPIDVKFTPSSPTSTARELANPISSMRFSMGTPSDQQRQIQSINTIKAVCGTNTASPPTERERAAQAKALDILDRLRRQMLISRFGSDFDWYLKIRDEVLSQPTKLNELTSNEKTKYLAIDAVATTSFLED